MLVNGFEVEKFNQYDFPENAKAHTCPFCSEQRKKKRDKCVKINWDKGFFKCFHCGEVGQLHVWKKKAEEKTDYVRPKWENNTNLSDKVVKWFEGRGISQFTLRRMKISEGVEMMPDRKSEKGWKKKNTIQFPYYRHGEVVNVKYR